MIVRPAPPDHYVWIAQRAHLVIGPAMRAIEAIDRTGNIAGMVAYDGWTDNAVSMHIALDNPAALRHLLRPAFGIPFVEYGKGVVFGTVLSDNERAMKLDLHAGFREVARLKDAWKVGVDMVFLEMRREDCRWIPQEARRAA